jgi:hypothetical protein
VASLLFWGLVFFVAPMLFYSPGYIIQSYADWYISLTEKNLINTSLTGSTDISVMGMFRRIFQNPDIPNTPFIAFAIMIFGLIYLRIKQFSSNTFRLYFLASVLLFTVLFSSGAESPTFIIAFCGVALWFVLQPKPYSRVALFLIIFAMILTSFSPSDLFPAYLREHYVKHYSLKALPCFIILLIIWFKLLKTDFHQEELNTQKV